jgi:hypothetical protein
MPSRSRSFWISVLCVSDSTQRAPSVRASSTNSMIFVTPQPHHGPDARAQQEQEARDRALAVHLRVLRELVGCVAEPPLEDDEDDEDRSEATEEEQTPEEQGDGDHAPPPDVLRDGE